MKVLLVLDEHRAVSVAAEFRRHGWEVAGAEDVPTGLSVARRDPPAAIVVGDPLPGGSSQTLITRLRGLVGTALTPVVALTSDEGHDDTMRAAGADVCLRSDADPAALRSAVERAVHGEVTPVTEAPSELLGETHRLTTLRATGLEPGEADRWFDAITAIAADLLPADTCLVSLVGQDQQFFPGRTDRAGDPGDRQTPLSQSFCQWAVTSGEQLVVEDAERHPLLRHNRAVDQLDVRAYAGVPMVADDASLGTVCAIDYQPRHWNEEHLQLLHRLAAIAEAELTLRLHAPQAPAEGGAAETVMGAAKRGLVETSRILADARPGPDRAAFDGLVALLAWFAEQIPDQSARHRAQGVPMNA